MNRFFAFVLLSFLIIPTANAAEFNADQQTQIKKMFEEYLLEHGDVVISSVEKFQKKQDEVALKESEVKAAEFLETIKEKSNLPMAGNKDGDITMIEFFDYNCGYCRRALDEIVTVLDKDKNVKVIFFDMPILGPSSLEASKWALAAHKQGKYFEFHKALLTHDGEKDEKSLEKIASDLGLDTKQLTKDKDSQEISDLLKDHIKQAGAMNIRGTPGFIINGKISPGYIPAAKIFEIIAEARKK